MNMGIDGIAAMVNQTGSSAAGSRAQALQNKAGSDLSGASDEELMNVCKQFEAYFVEQMFKEMVKTIPNESAGSGAMNSMLDFYKDEMIQDIAEETTNQNGGLGLAQMLYEQMRRNYGLDGINAEAAAGQL